MLPPFPIKVVLSGQPAVCFQVLNLSSPLEFPLGWLHSSQIKFSSIRWGQVIGGICLPFLGKFETWEKLGGEFSDYPSPYRQDKPRCSMYGIFTYIWLIFMVNVGKYVIHGSYEKHQHKGTTQQGCLNAT